MILEPVDASSVTECRDFLSACDLTVAGLDDPGVRLWVTRDASGAVVGSTGFETAGRHALLRSVAVGPALRGSGTGTRLATFALDQARAAGARTAWLFSRRSGPFWQGLGFASADREALAAVLATTTQVRLFRASGQLEHEIAWSRSLCVCSCT